MRQVLTILSLLVLIPLSVSEASSDVGDDFNDNQLDNTIWQPGNGVVLEEDGMLKLITAQTDVIGRVTTRWVDVVGSDMISVARDTYQHYANSRYIGQMSLQFDYDGDGSVEKQYDIVHANYTYTAGDRVARVGTYLAEDGRVARAGTNVSSQMPALWNQWFNEVLTYDPVAGELRYERNGQPLESLNLNEVATSPTDSLRVRVSMAPWGWFTGHYNYVDNFYLTIGDEVGEHKDSGDTRDASLMYLSEGEYADNGREDGVVTDREPFSVKVKYESGNNTPPEYVLFKAEGFTDNGNPAVYTFNLAKETESGVYGADVPLDQSGTFTYYFEASDGDSVMRFPTDSAEEVRVYDHLIIKYEPILRLHDDDSFAPMNVDAYVEGSALWEGTRTDTENQLFKAGELTLENLATSALNKHELYLAFSTPDKSRSYNVDKATSKYKHLENQDETHPTYYARKMEDSYLNGFTQQHFTVLQYWFFYAFNDWRRHGGLNNHEGDWESVFVFLDKDTEDPLYIAYSSHHNDGDGDDSLYQEAAVWRHWNPGTDIETVGSRPTSYVSLGSHANYPLHKEGGYKANLIGHVDMTQEEKDATEIQAWEERVIIGEDAPEWVYSYEGLWGSYFAIPGFNGPPGPNYIASLADGVQRFHEPVRWAGIKEVQRFIADQLINDVSVGNVHLMFAEDLPLETELVIEEHNEVINDGTNLSDLQLLPRFWDIKSTLENGTFNSQVTLPYSGAEVELLDVEEDDLQVFYYSPESLQWEWVPSIVNLEEDLITYTTNHFSRYAVGTFDEEFYTIDNLKLVLADWDTELAERFSRKLSVVAKLLEKGNNQAAKAQLTSIMKRLELVRYRTTETDFEQDAVTRLINQFLRKIEKHSGS